MSYNTSRPYLAAFVLLRRENKIAFILRTKTAWMNDHYGLPAGKVEIGERVQAAAVREAMEEAGVVVNEHDLTFLHVGHRWSEDNTLSWIDVFFEAKTWKGEPKNAEPHKHGKIDWFRPDDLPKNIIPAIKHYIEQIEAGNLFSEYGWPTN